MRQKNGKRCKREVLQEVRGEEGGASEENMQWFGVTEEDAKERVRWICKKKTMT